MQLQPSLVAIETTCISNHHNIDTQNPLSRYIQWERTCHDAYHEPTQSQLLFLQQAGRSWTRHQVPQERPPKLLPMPPLQCRQPFGPGLMPGGESQRDYYADSIVLVEWHHHRLRPRDPRKRSSPVRTPGPTTIPHHRIAEFVSPMSDKSKHCVPGYISILNTARRRSALPPSDGG